METNTRFNTDIINNDVWSASIQRVIDRVSEYSDNEYPSFSGATIYNDDTETDEEAPAADPIPTNETTEVIQTTSRFSSAVWFNKIQQQDILLGGVGGIGSYVAFLLSRMRPNRITIYDPDTVETVNMAGQLYGTSDVSKSKVRAIYDKVIDLSSYYHIYTYQRRFDIECQGNKVMICGFDNMEARKIFFYKWLEVVDSMPNNRKGECIFIDGRLNAEEFQVLCVTGDNQYAIQKYQNDWLFSDSEVEEAVCSYKQTSYAATMIGSVITNLFVNFCANMCDPIIPRDIPFLTRYDGTTMFFKTE